MPASRGRAKTVPNNHREHRSKRGREKNRPWKKSIRAKVRDRLERLRDEDDKQEIQSFTSNT